MKNHQIAKKIRSSPEDSKNINAESKEDAKSSALYDTPSTPWSSDNSPSTLNPVNTSPLTPDPFNKDVRCQWFRYSLELCIGNFVAMAIVLWNLGFLFFLQLNTFTIFNQVDTMQTSLPYIPPDLNRNITEIFWNLVNIYRGETKVNFFIFGCLFSLTSWWSDSLWLLLREALGEDRRSFSYYKAIAVIEKLSFKIDSADQVKDLPSIGKSLQDHVSEHAHE